MLQSLLLVVGLLLAEAAPHHETATATAVATASYDQAGPRMAAARVKNWASGYMKVGPSVSGSGTLMAVYGEQALVLTAGHLFEGKVGPITVEFNDGQRSGARLLAIDEQLDIAALWIFAPKGIRPLPMAQRDPILGQRVEIWGYGPKRFRSFQARVSRPIPMDNDVPDSLVAAQGVVDRQVTIPGDSGGAMVYEGHVVGVHWGYRGDDEDPRRSVHALGCTTLNQWLRTELDPSIWRRASFSQN
jgi:hypothetical protein